MEIDRMTSTDLELLPSVDSRWLGAPQIHEFQPDQCKSVQPAEKRNSGSEKKDLELPPGTKPLATQVAGHRKGPTSMVMLKCDGGHILKHVQPPPKGYREVQFYRQIFNPQVTDPVLHSLRERIPAFLGTVPEGAVENVTYFKMSDVTDRFSKPCISDIKMGQFTFDPLASEEKKQCEIDKYPPGLNLGFQMLGMRVYNKTEDKFDVYDRKYGRSLSESQVLEEGFGLYFGRKYGLRRDAIKCMLSKLREILSWFESQTQLAFYASSLLLMYEGDVCEDSLLGGSSINQSTSLNKQDRCTACHKLQQCCVADVKMIDFAHVFKTSKSDENYMFGLRKLISHLEKLVLKSV